MNKSKKYIVTTIIIMYAICALVKNIEFLFIRTDSTFLGENVICKIVCIIATLIATYKCGYRLSDIGFRNKDVLKYACCGFGLGIITFAASYGVELFILSLQGKNPQLSVYITNFGLTGATTEISLSFTAVIICIVGNIINVLAEEGMFRGFLLKTVSDKWGFRTGNYIQAFLFGIWHLVSCALGLYDGTMTVATAIVMGIGYVVLAGILALEWGICVNMTGVLWVGMFEHFFNNFISNALHVVTTEAGGIKDADSMQILRIVLSNILSLTIVLLINKRKASHSSISSKAS